MLKQSISIFLIILFSVIIIVAMPYAQQGLELLISAHEWIANLLSEVFSGAQAGNLIRQTLALLIIPLLFGFIPVLIFLLFRRGWFPYFMEMVWFVWLIQAAALVVQSKV